jgi:hypothetical protein
MVKKYLSSFAFKANIVYFGSVASKIIRKVQCNISHTLKFRISNQKDQCIKQRMMTETEENSNNTKHYCPLLVMIREYTTLISHSSWISYVKYCPWWIFHNIFGKGVCRQQGQCDGKTEVGKWEWLPCLVFQYSLHILSQIPFLYYK